MALKVNQKCLEAFEITNANHGTAQTEPLASRSREAEPDTVRWQLISGATS